MIEKDFGFVLKRRNFRETSLILSIYTRRFGKISGIFKGFYTGKREFSSSLDVGTLNEFIFYPKRREIWLVSAADLISDYAFIRADAAKARAAAVMLKLVDKTMPLWDSNYDVFYLLKESLRRMDNTDTSRVILVYLVKFLTLSGVKPEFNRCLFCHSLWDEDVAFSVSRGGLVCRRCRSLKGDYRQISPEAVSSLIYIQKSGFPQVYRIFPTARCQEEIRDILVRYLSYHFELGPDTMLLGGLPCSSGAYGR